jgi:4-hydroxybenzoate polyprenyltransferase
MTKNAAALRVSRLSALVRADEWWEFKFGPILAVTYGTALRAGKELSSTWPALAGIFIALACLGAWANVLNDWTDIDDDALAGKSNRMQGKPVWVPAGMVAGAMCLGLATVVWLRPGPLGLLLYVGNGLVFLLYSTPPVRLKTRGAWSAAADAFAVHVLPALFAIVSYSATTGIRLSPLWVTLVAAWTLGSGLRGILWHQLLDYENDRRTASHTFVYQIGPVNGRRLGTWVVFPLEVAALIGLLRLCPTTLPFIFLLFDSLLLWLRRVYSQERPAIVTAPPRYRIVLQEFSDTLLPLSLLTASTLIHPWDGVILGVHVVLFPVRLRRWLRDFGRLSYRHIKRSIRRLLVASPTS